MKINIAELIQENVPLAPLTSFQTGGPAQYYSAPQTDEQVRDLYLYAREHNLPVFLLGSGANILVSDQGIDGLVIATKDLKTLEWSEGTVTCGAGWEISELIDLCYEKSLSSLEFLYAMPSSVGGAVWMNARCYGLEIADRFLSATVLDRDLNLVKRGMDPSKWTYKVSPFQDAQDIVLSASFKTETLDPAEIQKTMIDHKTDRENKGHFHKPCAGSFFKNNRAFGKPSGQIIDELGLKGLSKGQAQVSPWHGNIIINNGGASAQDIWELGMEVHAKVLDATGFDLEPEVIPVGKWD
jgi:UDP-N-acetylmuramate dehydrogenase